MKHSKILSVLLTLALVLALSVPALAADGESGEDLTRGEFVTALFQLTDEWDVEPSQDYFDDVPAEGGLAQCVRWAAENGIVNGYGNGKFGPDDPVTREQMAAMLYRSAQRLGQGYTDAWLFPLDEYPDAAEISPWADEAMHWMVMNGIITGTDKGLEPKALAAEDQLSLVLQRWQKSMIETDDGVWYSFDDVAVAMKVPEDMEFEAYGDGLEMYIGRSDRLFIDFSLWDQVGGPEIDDLAALAAESTMEPAHIVEQGGLRMVKGDRADGETNYLFMAPNGDSWYLWILPNTEAHPELTAADVAEEVKAVEESLCHSLNIPEGEKAVEMLPFQRPSIDYLALVNKLNALPEGWEDDLQIVWTVNSVDETVEVERTAYKKYLELKADLAENDGIYVELDSARRSVAAQQDIMDRFIEKYGADYAAKTVAQPGYSEHHTGLALDLYFRTLNEDGSFTDVYYNEDMEKEEYKGVWETIHAKLAQYGFILRYLEGKEHITGYRYEPWHIRYVGSAENAYQIMSQTGLTLEEYLAGRTLPEVEIDLSGSALYTEEELYDAMLAVKCKFASFADCELHSIRYAGDTYNTEENIGWMNELDEGKGYTQVAMFLSDFHSPVEDGPYAWEPDTEYTDYQWWLARTEEDGWQLLNWGYGGGEPAADPGAWTRAGYFQDEDGNFLSVTWMDDVIEPGWYVGCQIGDIAAGWTVQPEGDTLHGDLNAWDESAEPFVVTVSEEGEEGLLLVVEGGETYHFMPMDLPKATIFVHINVDGIGNIDYAPGETAPEIDEEYPWQSAQINLEEPEVYTITAWTKAEDWGFIKWTKDGEDYTTDPTFTVELSESADYVAVFEFLGGDGQNPVMNFVGRYACDRARAQVDCFGEDGAQITVTWGGSAWDLTRWVIVGPLEPDTLTVEYAGCVKTIETYDDNGELVSEKVVYEDGTGTVVFGEDGTFTWHEDQSEADGDLVFAWVPVEG